VAVAAALVAGLVVVAATPQLGGSAVGKALDALDGVSPSWLALAALGFAGSIVCSAGSWACALAAAGARVALPDATARYGVGGLVNTFLPARAGDAVRIALFSKRVDRQNRVWTTGGAFAAIGVARAAWSAVLVLAAFSTGALPLWPAFALGGVALAGLGAAFALRHRTGERLRSLLESLETLRHSPRSAAKLLAWIGGSTAARVLAAAAVASAMGVHSPLVAALLIVPALDVAGLLPLTPGNLGVASGAVAVALQGHGVDGTTALATGMAFHAVETLASLAVGAAGALTLAQLPEPVRRVAPYAGAGACACAAAGLGVIVLNLV
jgi:uncharacterized membrane protein YbhN (UPF0104 family)